MVSVKFKGHNGYVHMACPASVGKATSKYTPLAHSHSQNCMPRNVTLKMPWGYPPAVAFKHPNDQTLESGCSGRCLQASFITTFLEW